MSETVAHPVVGATPPAVFSRWINVVRVSLSPSVGPGWSPTTSSKSQGIAPGATNAESDEEAIATAQTVLLSLESCHVARGVPPSAGLGLRKCVRICLSLFLNKVACGPKNSQVKLVPGKLAKVLLRAGSVTNEEHLVTCWDLQVGG